MRNKMKFKVEEGSKHVKLVGNEGGMMNVTR